MAVLTRPFNAGLLQNTPNSVSCRCVHRINIFLRQIWIYLWWMSATFMLEFRLDKLPGFCIFSLPLISCPIHSALLNLHFTSLNGLKILEYLNSYFQSSFDLHLQTRQEKAHTEWVQTCHRRKISIYAGHRSKCDCRCVYLIYIWSHILIHICCAQGRKHTFMHSDQSGLQLCARCKWKYDCRDAFLQILKGKNREKVIHDVPFQSK